MNSGKIIEIVRQKGTVCAEDLKKAGISKTSLYRMVNNGDLRKAARGVYTLAGHYLAYEAFIKLMTSAPKSVICLLSALQFHEITTQMPFETWVATDKNSTIPKISNARIIKMSGKAFSEGIGTYEKDGVKVRVYCPAKTVVDCFKFRNKIGIDVAREALIDCLDQKKATRDEIWSYAKICRMTNVMRPYLEMS